MAKYELLNLTIYTDYKKDRLALLDENMQLEIEDKVRNMFLNLANPFEELYHWCKGEIYDLQAMQDMLAVRETLEKQQTKIQGNKKSAQNDLENMNMGKKTIRTVFKKETDTEAMAAQIQMNEQEIEKFEKFLGIVTVHIGQNVIPRFKREKLEIYKKVVTVLSYLEISNAHLGAVLWQDVFKLPALDPYRK